LKNSVLMLVVAALIGSCGTAEEPSTESTATTTTATDSSRATPPTATTPAASVDWENYAPEVKARIDALGQAKDCTGLQDEFDTANANDAAQSARVGDGNADLMSYVDEWLRLAGCY
jgi:hypothetical protein